MPPSAAITHTVSARIIRLILGLASRAGVAPEALLAHEGLRPEMLEGPDVRVPLEAEGRLWEEAARLTGDDCFGLHAAELLQPGAFDVLDYSVRSSPTLGEAVQRLSRYNRLLHDVAEIRLEVRGDEARVRHRFPTDPRGAVRQAAEFTVASWVIVGRQASGQALPLRSVGFQHPEPASTQEHRRLFGCPVRFGQDCNELVLERRMLDVPFQKADPGLCAVLDRHAEELLARLPRAEPFDEALRRAICEELKGGTPNIRTVAARLRISTRTLQRRLGEEGSSFQELVDTLRRELALRHLADERTAIAEVAFLLGFSEPRAFHRAFKRWTGQTPGEYRQHAAH
ncbi:AraC family transcriptional regulator [Vitiosangium sp. GDMCC 1.1324]|uniref:AraC-like transcriptional regulator QhpR n=1 Tax=Vitiosangium sp. (strain GDMCC 1.1324) TaxID=2138576 RepID=UPI000D3376AA|nr:AraC family transcriptional regulator [Vitiosangium sp. GDMCC 1.1324]PTL85703.1 AraC family transcriptional regulator [Vitiosangium sp. GDMCC 1.1324]